MQIGRVSLSELGRLLAHQRDGAAKHSMKRAWWFASNDQDESWSLMTDLDDSVEKLTDQYGRRMTIEELFREEKNPRHGWALRNTLITRRERLDRLLQAILTGARNGLGISQAPAP